MSWFKELFIDEVKPALDRHSNTGGSGEGSGEDVEGQTYVLIDEEGNEYPAVYLGEETVFDATANDIREGKTAVSESGVVVGTKEIPAYITTEGRRVITAGKPISLKMTGGKHNHTKLQAIVCSYNTSMSNSVAAEKVCIENSVYPVASIEVISTVMSDDTTETIEFGITNDGTKPVIVRFFTYKEEY